MADGLDFDWQVQIGPDIFGSAEGVVNSTSANFYVSVGSGDPKASYVSYSTSAASEWIPIPNNTPVHASGPNHVQYRYAVPPGVTIKIVIGVK
jgi:hypothetical protein